MQAHAISGGSGAVVHGDLLGLGDQAAHPRGGDGIATARQGVGLGAAFVGAVVSSWEPVTATKLTLRATNKLTEDFLRALSGDPLLNVVG